MKTRISFFCRLILTALLIPLGQLHADDDGITWLIEYDGKSLPAAPWTTMGKPIAKLEADGLWLTVKGSVLDIDTF